MVKIKSISFILAVLIMSFLIGYLVFAWQDPPIGATPPEGNVPAPINVSNVLQTKAGTLRVSGFESSSHTYLATGGSNVGIGTTSPAQKLHVFTNSDAWAIQAGDQSGSNTNLRIAGTASGATGYGLIGVYAGAGNLVQRNLILQRDGGNVGIGIATPAERLHVAGRIRLGNDPSDAMDAVTKQYLEQYVEDHCPSNGGGGNGNGNGDFTTCGDNITFTYKGSTVTYGTVSSTDNRCWMDRNLGASRAATAYNDFEAHGDLFQWGRLDDGHQTRTSGMTTTLSSTDVPGHSNFIRNTHSATHYDWRSPQNHSLWQVIDATNDPCPTSWRVPTKIDWETEVASWSSQNYNGAFLSPLKLVVGGSRTADDRLSGVGSIGWYWSTSVASIKAYCLVFYDTYAGMNEYQSRAAAMSVRCIKD